MRTHTMLWSTFINAISWMFTDSYANNARYEIISRD